MNDTVTVVFYGGLLLTSTTTLVLMWGWGHRDDRVGEAGRIALLLAALSAGLLTLFGFLASSNEPYDFGGMLVIIPIFCFSSLPLAVFHLIAFVWLLRVVAHLPRVRPMSVDRKPTTDFGSLPRYTGGR